ncbi:EAL domain-containing protein [Azoarcus sp. L1K30]|uniref:putative bifunctional diguanylate cyclase/phosphodiesterase n=1 Tax=Azoarcus sp. L1K30 TaxID=2820277 RepID=UPI001B842BE6|nr:EAL domain-containing protein [Azoarcus sp. L1K30]MBR0567148.1 EAL domain-containing protein [Azoarcus sp. L1K30]
MARTSRTPRAHRLSLLSTALALLIAFVLLIVHQYFVGRQVLLDELSTEAAILAENSNAAVVFNDAAAAREIISAIRLTPRIQSAALYRQDSSLLASWPEDHPAFPPTLETHLDADRFGASAVPNETTLGFRRGVMREAVQVDGSTVGTLILNVDFSSLYWRLLEYAGGVLGIASVALSLAYRLTRRLRKQVASAERRMERLALYDHVTGLPNRRLFEQELRKVVDRVGSGGTLAALLFLDVDDFKKVNDAFGHEVGDRVLSMIGQRLKHTVRVGDVVARIGGDEFAVVLLDVGGPDNAAIVARSLIEVIGRPFSTEPTPSHIGLSVGIAMMPGDGGDPAALLRHADMAMYVAKAQGKNRFQFFSESIDGKVRQELRLESELRQALAKEDGGLWVAYQPKLCARTRQVVGVEALARWCLPDGRPVSPADFIPVAERTGLITALGDRLLERICRDLAGLRCAGFELASVAVNVSSLQLLQGPALVERFCSMLAAHGESVSQFEFELTESALTDARGASVLEAFRLAGFKLSIDDFGTGYSSLGYLKRFDVTTLKVDQCFVRALPDDAEDAAIVIAVIQMAHALGISVVAEGVETEAQADFLLRHECDVLQGYLLGMPMPASELADYLGQRNRVAGGVRAVQPG